MLALSGAVAALEHNPAVRSPGRAAQQTGQYYKYKCPKLDYMLYATHVWILSFSEAIVVFNGDSMP
jgi:hypothetical protein